MNFTQFLRKYCQNLLLRKENRFVFLGRTLVINITSRCNFSCKHCLRSFDDKPKDIPIDVVEKTLLEAKKYNFKHIALTGGEPFLYPKIEELMALITKNGYTFSIVSNGYNFSQFVDLLKKQTKLALVTFSLESSSCARHNAQRQIGSFEKLLNNFQLCKAHKIPFGIVSVASSINYDEIFDIALFAKKKGAKVLMIGGIIPCPRSEKNNLVLEAAKREELFTSLRGPMYKLLKLPLVLNADICGINDIKICRPLLMTDVAIDVEGNIVHCCELDNIDDEKLRRSAVITSLKDKSFDDALKILSEHLHKFTCMRIDDFKTEPHPQSIDFNSCFYCVRRLGSLS